jgi:hypothetical protein
MAMEPRNATSVVCRDAIGAGYGTVARVRLTANIGVGMYAWVKLKLCVFLHNGLAR